MTRPAGRSLLAFTLLIGALTALAPLSIDMYLPAFPQIAAGLDTGASQVQLTLTACVTGLAVGQLIAGPTSDARGRKGPLLVGLAAYATASVGCAIAPDIFVLTTCRVLQGLAGAAAIVLARAVVADVYHGSTAARFFSRLVLVTGLAPMLAPIVGGQVLRFTSWRGIFVVLAAIGAALLVVAVGALPETLPVDRRSSAGMRHSLRALRAVAADRGFAGFALTQALGFAAMFAYIAGSPFVVQDVFGASPQVFSVLFGVNALGLVAASQLNGWLVGRVPPRRLLTAGLAAEVTAAAALVAIALAGLGLPALAAGMFTLVVSLGFIMPNSTALALSRHPRQAGSASALLGTAQFVFAAGAAPLVGLRGGALSMAVVIAAFAVAALATFVALARRAPTPVAVTGQAASQPIDVH